MASATLINPNPIVYEKKRTGRRQTVEPCDEGDATREAIDDLEIFDHIRDITDPEHPYSLEQLNVVNQDHVEVDDEKGTVKVVFTPTVEHCSMATLIGLCIRVKLLRVLHQRFKVDIAVAEGSHASEDAINKQLNDKERVTAALENPNLIEMVDKCLQSEHMISS
ncbi:hypothetical protein BSKO_07097 [Bryopsis sp. KO-2023]|nr:hypothetical protein BSKO_07097 [Bryopsis sp. KO-2023]